MKKNILIAGLVCLSVLPGCTEGASTSDTSEKSTVRTCYRLTKAGAIYANNALKEKRKAAKAWECLAIKPKGLDDVENDVSSGDIVSTDSSNPTDFVIYSSDIGIDYQGEEGSPTPNRIFSIGSSMNTNADSLTAATYASNTEKSDGVSFSDGVYSNTFFDSKNHEEAHDGVYDLDTSEFGKMQNVSVVYEYIPNTGSSDVASKTITRFSVTMVNDSVPYELEAIRDVYEINCDQGLSTIKEKICKYIEWHYISVNKGASIYATITTEDDDFETLRSESVNYAKESATHSFPTKQISYVVHDTDGNVTEEQTLNIKFTDKTAPKLYKGDDEVSSIALLETSLNAEMMTGSNYSEKALALFESAGYKFVDTICGELTPTVTLDASGHGIFAVADSAGNKLSVNETSVTVAGWADKTYTANNLQYVFGDDGVAVNTVVDKTADLLRIEEFKTNAGNAFEETYYPTSVKGHDGSLRISGIGKYVLKADASHPMTVEGKAFNGQSSKFWISKNVHCNRTAIGATSTTKIYLEYTKDEYDALLASGDMFYAPVVNTETGETLSWLGNAYNSVTIEYGVTLDAFLAL